MANQIVYTAYEYPQDSQNIEIDADINGNWQEVYTGNDVVSGPYPFVAGTWTVNLPGFPALQSCTGIKFLFSESIGYYPLYEMGEIGYATQPVVCVSGVSSVVHTVTTSLTDGTLSLQVDSRTPATIAYSGSVPDTTNAETIDQNGVMPYISNYVESVGGTEKLRYQPNTIIQGTALPDLDSTQPGVITFGTNPSGVSTSFGAFNVGSVATATIPGGGSPNSEYPAGMPPLTDEGNYSGIPGAVVVNTLLDSSAIPLALFWDTFLFAGIIGLGFAVMVWTKQIWLAGIACSVGFALFSYNPNDGINFTGGILPFWTVIVCIMATIIVGVLQDKGVIKI
jgi:hypothetical protein